MISCGRSFVHRFPVSSWRFFLAESSPPSPLLFAILVRLGVLCCLDLRQCAGHVAVPDPAARQSFQERHIQCFGLCDWPGQASVFGGWQVWAANLKCRSLLSGSLTFQSVEVEPTPAMVVLVETIQFFPPYSDNLHRNLSRQSECLSTSIKSDNRSRQRCSAQTKSSTRRSCWAVCTRAPRCTCAYISVQGLAPGVRLIQCRTSRGARNGHVVRQITINCAGMGEGQVVRWESRKSGCN